MRDSLENLRQRFMSKVSKRGRGHVHHWIWKSARRVDGIPVFWYQGRSHDARRFACALQDGFIDAGEQVYNTCGRDDCVNTAHIRREYHTLLRRGKVYPRKIVLDERKYTLAMF